MGNLGLMTSQHKRTIIFLLNFKGDKRILNEHELTPRDLIYPKEKLYFWIVMLISIATYVALVVTIVILPFIFAIFIISLLFHGIMIGQIRTNGVKLSPAQFPTVYNKVDELCKKMELTKVPDVYVVQEGGMLNAFATRFFNKNMIVVYSEIFDLIEEGREDELTFILAHELAHIKRNHLGKSAFILPAS